MSAGCFHCGLPLPAGRGWAVVIDRVAHLTCCPGCQAVACSIVASGLGDYYRDRTALPGTSAAVAADVPAALRLYDAADAMPPSGEAPDADAELADAMLSVEGIRCAACVWLVERRLARLPGMVACNMNVGNGRLHVRWRRGACKPSDILLAIREVGYVAWPFDAARQEGQLQRARKRLFRQLFVAGLSMMQVMMYAAPAYVAEDGGMDAGMTGLMRWASLLLTLPALCYSAQPFFQGAWAGLRHRALGMDVPVALGIAAAFIGSAVATVRGDGEVYFDSVTMFIFLLLCSRYLELAARHEAASALQRLSHAMPEAALRLPGWPASRDVETVAAAALACGDVVLVRPGDAAPADGTVIEGDSAIDLSLLTGESRPRAATVGDLLPGGAVNTAQPFLLRVTHPVAQSTLAALVRLAERAGQGKPRIALWADRAAAWFVAALLLLAGAAFFYWQWADPQRAWPIAIAMLVVSCPCALSLATPSALAAATDALLRRGVLVARSHVLETLHRATHIVFDKTGTLTLGKPALRQVKRFCETPQARLLLIAAGLEVSSTHPLGIALVEAAVRRGLAPAALDVRELRHVAGQGIEGVVNGVRYRLGSAAFARASGGFWQPDDPACSSVYLAGDDCLLARFDLADTVRDDARATIAYFQAAGKRVILLSGDDDALTQRVARGLGIDTASGACLPEGKLRYVQDLQRGGAVVAMVGDGINDAAVLRAADVSFAMGAGAALAQSHADAVLLSPRLGSIRDAAAMAARTMAVIRQNLVWATLYNLVAIPAAALGWLNPWLCGVGMSASSAVVVLNALRLRRMPIAAAAPAAAAGA